VKERIGAPVKILEITGEKDDAEGITIAPFDLDFFPVDEHSDERKRLGRVYRRVLSIAWNLVSACVFTVDLKQE
jgi:cyanophycinase-like exopeptidase